MANILGQPRFWDKKAIVALNESTYGVDELPSGANYIEARNVTLTSFDPELVDRGIIIPTFGKGGQLIVAKWAKLSFDFALTWSRLISSTPAWRHLVRVCGFSETVNPGVSDTFNLISSAFPSLTVYLNIDGVNYKFIGSRGELKVKLSAKGIPMATVELQSVYATPVETAMPALTKTGWTTEEAVNSTNTQYLAVNGVNLAFSDFEWATGNKIARINLPGPQLEVAITDREPSSSAMVLAPALSVFNPYALAETGSAITVSNTHGSTSSKMIKSDLKGKIVGVAEDQIEGLLAYKLTMSLEPVNGNDEITLTCL